MTNTNFAVFGLGTPNRGELKQIYGAFAALAELTGNSYDFEQMFLLPLGVSSVAEMKDAIRPSDYKNYSQFKTALFETLRAGIRTADIEGHYSCSKFSDEIIKRLRCII